MLSHDPSMSSLQLLYTNLEKYIEHKPKYDKFYLAYLDMCSNMNFDGIIEIYLQSNIRMQSLQKGFNSRESEKAEKQKYFRGLSRTLRLLKSEKSIVGDYLKKMDIGQELRIQDCFIVNTGDPCGDFDGDQGEEIIHRFPQSCEVMMIYLDGVQTKNE